MLSLLVAIVYCLASNSDYTSVSSDEIFASGSADNDTRCLSITILDDSLFESDEEDFSLILTTPDPNVILGNNETIITIMDNNG